jgi:4,5:9,10-diseco-3-hydroxy-5,9,17-trioxoandrosta-1(10),2-diene-4-oate hydrolase
MMRGVIDAVAKVRPVVALDLPGFGESDRPPATRYRYDLVAFAETVRHVMQRLEIPRAALVGHDLGGGAAMTLAAREPDAVERLFLMAPTVWSPPESLDRKLMATPMVGPLLWSAMRRMDFARRLRTEWVRSPAAVDDATIDYYWERLQRGGGHESAFHTYDGIMQLREGSTHPERVQAPTEIVWGDADRVQPVSQGMRLEQAIAGATLTALPGCGHLAFLERPDEISARVVAFLNQPGRSS